MTSIYYPYFRAFKVPRVMQDFQYPPYCKEEKMETTIMGYITLRAHGCL